MSDIIYTANIRKQQFIDKMNEYLAKGELENFEALLYIFFYSFVVKNLEELKDQSIAPKDLYLHIVSIYTQDYPGYRIPCKKTFLHILRLSGLTLKLDGVNIVEDDFELKNNIQKISEILQ